MHPAKKMVPMLNAGFPGSSAGKEPTSQRRRYKRLWVRSLGREDPLEKEMANHSSIFAWRTPWTEESDRLCSPLGHKELDMTACTSVHTCVCTHTRTHTMLNAGAEPSLPPPATSSSLTSSRGDLPLTSVSILPNAPWPLSGPPKI